MLTVDDDLESALAAVGPRLRALRRQRGITLAELAVTTGISESTLSRLESGQRRANLELLLPLARAHSVPLDDLVGAPRTGDPRVHLKPIHRHGMTFIPLSRRPGGLFCHRVKSRSSTPGSRTSWAAPTTRRSSCSSCSASKANAHTSAHAPPEPRIAGGECQEIARPRMAA